VSDLPPPPRLPPPPPPGGGPADGPLPPYLARPRIRWGIGDAVLAFVVGIVAGVVVAAPFLGSSSDSVTTPAVLIASIFGQDLAIIGWLAMVARRKGMGSLGADFGLTFRPALARGIGELKWLLIGVGVQLVALAPTALLQELHGGDAKQDVVSTAGRAHGLEVVLMIVGVALLAPLTEELLFRGALLRSVMRRTTPGVAVFVSACVFGLVHAIGDPSVGTLIALPAIIALGIVSGYQAVKTGDLARSVMLHVGFNALSVILLFTT
jgi:membrane protease YdiL (CAAX protease family)